MTPHPRSWLRVTPSGLWCEPGGFFIDPMRAVERAVITHAHSDHARPGHEAVLASPATLALMRTRLGDAAGRAQQPLGWGERLRVGEVVLWLEPAGHVLGSAQVVMEWRGSRAVVSGDYKRRPDPTCDGFVPVPCDVFVTEATFALPVFRHPPPEREIARLLASVALFPERAHLVGWLGHQDGIKSQLSVLENLAFYARLYGQSGADLHGILDEVGLTRARDLPGQYLSAGMRRRLALARLLVSRRPVWLLDEPLAALDVRGKAMVGDFVKAHCRDGGLVIAATHEALGLDCARLELGAA